MADFEERPGDDWGDVQAKWTFICTAILAVLFVAAVFIYVF